MKNLLTAFIALLLCTGISAKEKNNDKEIRSHYSDNYGKYKCLQGPGF
jgi:hypothetical protein